MAAPDIQRSDWLEMRGAGIGSSEAADACGESNVSPAELVLQKRGIMKRSDLSENEAAFWGTILEPVIVSVTSSRRGLRLLDPVLDRTTIEHEIEKTGETEVLGWVDGRQAFLRSVSRPWQHAAIDGIAVDENSGLIDIEAKGVGFYFSTEWDQEIDRAPEKFDVQVAHQLAVAPAFKEAYLAGLVGGNSLRIIRRERVLMHAKIEAVTAIEAEVWRCVETGELPSFDGSESHVKAIRALHPHDTGRSIVFPAEAVEWHEDLQAMQKQRVWIDKEVKALRLKMEAAMDGATYGILPGGGGCYTNHHQERKEHVVPASTFTVLRFTNKRDILERVMNGRSSMDSTT